MYYIKHILPLILVFRLSWALQECSILANQSRVAVCVKERLSYVKSAPPVLDTELYLLDIIGINENENSIHIFIELITHWNDSNLALSDGSE